MTTTIKTYQKKLCSKEIEFYKLLKNDPHFDYVLFPEKIEESIGYFPFSEDGNLVGKDKRYYVLAVQAIAKFHHFVKNIKFDFLKIDQEYYSRALKNTFKYAMDHQIDLPARQIKELEKSVELIKRNFTPIHDDFLSQNVVVIGEEIKIIDWEDMRFGFAEHDVGRFLGDLNGDKPSWNKKYYPLSWRDELERGYLETRKQLNPQYDIQKGRELIYLGEMWNYLGPIEMCLKRGDTKSDWFLANLEALKHA